MDNTEQRFWRFVDKNGPNGCWLWTGSRTGENNSYGSFAIKYNKNTRAHRYSYVLFHGEIPVGLLVCHHCDNPLCVNPSHLFLGTQKDNMQDASKKGRLCTVPKEPKKPRLYTGPKEPKKPRPLIKSCKYGHPLTPDNLRGIKYKRCAICATYNDKKQREKHKLIKGE